MLTPDAAARRDKVLAQISAGKCGFLAQIMAAEGNAECRHIGKQMDAELLQRDVIIMRLQAQVAGLTAQVEMLKEQLQKGRAVR